MQIFKNYYNNVIKYDLINKFYYTNHKQIPQIINIILNFNCKNLKANFIYVQKLERENDIIFLNETWLKKEENLNEE